MSAECKDSFHHFRHNNQYIACLFVEQYMLYFLMVINYKKLETKAIFVYHAAFFSMCPSVACAIIECILYHSESFKY